MRERIQYHSTITESLLKIYKRTSNVRLKHNFESLGDLPLERFTPLCPMLSGAETRCQVPAKMDGLSAALHARLWFLIVRQLQSKCARTNWNVLRRSGPALNSNHMSGGVIPKSSDLANSEILEQARDQEDDLDHNMLDIQVGASSSDLFFLSSIVSKKSLCFASLSGHRRLINWSCRSPHN